MIGADFLCKFKVGSREMVIVGNANYAHEISLFTFILIRGIIYLKGGVLMEKKPRKPRSGTRSAEERADIISTKQKFHQDCIDRLETQKQRILNPAPRVRMSKKISDEDKQALDLIKQSGKTYAELLELLK